MARFRTDGLNDLIADMRRLGEDQGEIADRMLLAGAEEVRKSWRAAALFYGHKATGKMIDSITYARTPKTVSGIKTIDIYPQGKNHKGIRNAEVAFVLHYGTSRMRGSHWVDKADADAGEPVERVMTEIWDEELRKRGL